MHNAKKHDEPKHANSNMAGKGASKGTRVDTSTSMGAGVGMATAMDMGLVWARSPAVNMAPVGCTTRNSDAEDAGTSTPEVPRIIWNSLRSRAISAFSRTCVK